MSLFLKIINKAVYINKTHIPAFRKYNIIPPNKIMNFKKVSLTLYRTQEQIQQRQLSN